MEHPFTHISDNVRQAVLEAVDVNEDVRAQFCQEARKLAADSCFAEAATVYGVLLFIDPTNPAYLQAYEKWTAAARSVQFGPSYFES